MIERKTIRYSLLDKTSIKAYIKLHQNQDFSEVRIYDISKGGICLIMNRENFIQFNKPYPIQVCFLDEKANPKKIIQSEATQVWYLLKEFKEVESLYIGFIFKENIEFNEDLINESV